MPFYEIEFPLGSLSPDALDDALREIGALSVTYVDNADDEPVLEPRPGEVRLWRDTLVRALFDQSSDPLLNLHKVQSACEALVADGEHAAGAHLAGAVRSTDGAQLAGAARVRAVADQAWERVWLSGWKSMRFGRRLWVCPTTAPLPDDPEAVVVRLDPGLAFGTGSHPTTALCLQILDSLPITGRSIIDYGCGSGILGVAALKLGASRVTAVDIDPQALVATRDNAARNQVAKNMTVQDADAELPRAFCVLANILAGPLIELAPRLTAVCEGGGHLVLSGLLRTQAYAVKAAYAGGFDKVQVASQDDWCCIYARRGA
jgi:ribosomal protein L11 methyltransferase